MAMSEKKICGNCARFKVPNTGCLYAKQISEGTLRADDSACELFLDKSSVQLGDFIIKKLSANIFVLYDEKREPIYTFGKRGLSSDRTKEDLCDKTGVDQEEVDRVLAKLVERTTNQATTIPQKKEPEKFDEAIYEKAQGILTQENPFDYILKTIALIHAGDEEAAQIEWISALSSRLSRTKINTWVIGKSGKGKSHLKYAVIQILPNELYEIFTSSSPLALFYYVKEYGENALDGMLLYLDETESSRFSEPVLRSLTSQTEILPRHLSVHEAEVLDLKITGSRTVWFTSVKTFGTEQIRNRFINTNPDESKEQDNLVWQLQDGIYRENVTIPDEPFKISKAITQTIIRETEPLSVTIPFSIKWPFKERRFLYPIFIAFIQVITKINFKKRQKDSESRLVATVEDFNLAKKLWKSFEESIMYRVSKSAITVLEKLPSNREEAKTHAEISEELPLSTRWIQNLCDELLEEGLINAIKRTREGPGRQAWEYWKASLPTIEDVEIESHDNFGISEVPPQNKSANSEPDKPSSIPETHFQKSEIPTNLPAEKTETNITADNLATNSEKQGFLLKHIAPAEKCELCGLYAVEFSFLLDGQEVRRCKSCIDRMRSSGLVFGEEEEAKEQSG